MKERKRNRMLGFDYSTEAIYFLTCCTQDRVCYFGQVKNQKMMLNIFGEITHNQIQWLEQQYPYFHLHNFVVMPNHVHILCEIEVGRNINLDVNNGDCPVKIKSISELMGAFKTTSSKQIHKAGNAGFKWQRSFHDHIVRNERAYNNINNYITQNPIKWGKDTFN
jgi:putative transposase